MGSLLLNLLLALLLWLRQNFRRVSAEHFIGFRRVPGQFLSRPFPIFVNTSAAFDADVLIAPHGSALLLTLLLWLGRNFCRASAEHFISFRRVPGQFLSPPSFSKPAFSRDVCSNTQILNASASFGGWCESAFFKGCP